MFILYAIPIGIVAGYLLGGRLDRLGDVRFRWAPLALLGLVVQVALFTDPLGDVVGDAGPPIYVASTAIVLVAVLRNLAIPGVAIVAVGAASNLRRHRRQRRLHAGRRRRRSRRSAGSRPATRTAASSPIRSSPR